MKPNVPGESRWEPVGPGESRWEPVGPGESRWVPVSPGGSRWVPVRPGESRWVPVSPGPLLLLSPDVGRTVSPSHCRGSRRTGELVQDLDPLYRLLSMQRAHPATRPRPSRAHIDTRADPSPAAIDTETGGGGAGGISTRKVGDEDKHRSKGRSIQIFYLNKSLIKIVWTAKCS